MTKGVYPVGSLLQGKCGLIMGVANDHSLAWGAAQALRAQGAELAFSYQSSGLLGRLEKLVQGMDNPLLVECDVEQEGAIAKTFASVAKVFPKLDFVIHSLAYSDRSELKGSYLDTSRENFRRSMLISCYSLTEVTRYAAPMMREGGGSIITLTFLGARRVIPSYNVMGVAKAALEASVRYLASDLGPSGVRVNAVSPGPMRTISGAAIGNGRSTYNRIGDSAPLGRNAELAEVGAACLYFASELSSGVTGQLHHVDGGYNIMGISV